MKKTAEKCKNNRCNEEPMETRSRRSNIILSYAKESLFLCTEDIRRGFSQKSSILFYFCRYFSRWKIRERRRTKAWLAFFLFFFLPLPPIARPCRFILVAKRNTEVCRCLTARHAGSGTPGSCSRNVTVSFGWGQRGAFARVSERNIKKYQSTSFEIRVSETSSD